MVYVASSGSGAGVADSVTTGSGMISGKGMAAGVVSRTGSLVASAVCKISGAGSARTSVITGTTVISGVGGVASITSSGT